LHEPPVKGVYFYVPYADSGISDQVLVERSNLYRWIATEGSLGSHQNVRHPYNGQFVPHP
jgi:hypothetical protein